MKAIINGAGIAGLTLAWWLHRDNWDVQLIERAPAPRAQGYMIDFVGAGYDVAERMGMLDRLHEIQTRITTVRYVDPRGRGRGWFDYGQLASAWDGRACTFMRGDLERVLYDMLDDRVPVRYGTTVDAVHQTAGAVEVRLSDGTTESADLLVGADGIHSRVRELVFGPEQPLVRYMGFHTASYLRERNDIDVGNRFLLVAAPGRQVGLYPTNDGRLGIWLTHRSGDPVLHSDPTRLLDTYRGMGDLVDAALENVGDLYYDQVSQIVLDNWTRGRVTLIGDACQAVSLLAGQGASLGMAGAYVLAQELRRGTPSEAAARYEQRMRPTVRASQEAGRRTANWLVPSTDRRITVRAAGFAATRLPAGKRLTRAALSSVTSDIDDLPEPDATRETSTIRLPDGRALAYTTWGDPDGFPVFYFHGTPGSRMEGAFAAGAADRHGFRLIAVDRPGYGRSDRKPGRRFTDWPADVLALADALGIDRFGVAGHSGGGPHLFACGALIPPERLAFIGALGPWGPVATTDTKAGLHRLDRWYTGLTRRVPWLMRASFAPLGWCAKYTPGLFLSMLRSASSPPDRAALRTRRLSGHLRLSEKEAFRQGGAGASEEALLAYGDWGFDVAAVRVPTHLWFGGRDIYVSPAMGRELADRIPGADVHWLPERGHFAIDAWDDIFAACKAQARVNSPSR